PADLRGFTDRDIAFDKRRRNIRGGSFTCCDVKRSCGRAIPTLPAKARPYAQSRPKNFLKAASAKPSKATRKRPRDQALMVTDASYASNHCRAKNYGYGKFFGTRNSPRKQGNLAESPAVELFVP